MTLHTDFSFNFSGLKKLAYSLAFFACFVSFISFHFYLVSQASLKLSM